MAKQEKLKIHRGILVAAFVVALYLLASYAAQFFSSNVDLKGNKEISVYVPTGATMQEFQEIVRKQGFLRDYDSFVATIERAEFTEPIPGRYVVSDGMSNYSMVRMFGGGRQTPVMLRVPSVRTSAQMAERLAKQVEPKADEILEVLRDRAFLDSLGFSPETAIALFLPDSYELYWNQSARGLVLRMHKEYQKYWTDKRIDAARELKMGPHEVATLASIVQSEQTRFDDEKSTIAGLYLNRLRIGQRLESDPTLIFALGNFSIQRVLAKDKLVDSPYNTYKYAGLPPGPILAPEKSSIDAVLNAEKHNYFFMCAKDDFSGRHFFAQNYEQHKKYAALYRKALDKRGIKR